MIFLFCRRANKVKKSAKEKGIVRTKPSINWFDMVYYGSVSSMIFYYLLRYCVSKVKSNLLTNLATFGPWQLIKQTLTSMVHHSTHAWVWRCVGSSHLFPPTPWAPLSFCPYPPPILMRDFFFLFRKEIIFGFLPLHALNQWICNIEIWYND